MLTEEAGFHKLLQLGRVDHFYFPLLCTLIVVGEEYASGDQKEADISK